MYKILSKHDSQKWNIEENVQKRKLALQVIGQLYSIIYMKVPRIVETVMNSSHI